MAAFEVEKDGAVYRLASIDEVVRLVRLGVIHDEDPLRKAGRKTWGKAGDLEELHQIFEEDTWDAWGALGDDDPELAWEEAATWVSGEPPKQAEEEVEAVAPEKEESAEPEEPEPEEPEPEEPEPEEPEPVSRPVAPAIPMPSARAEVIAFPGQVSTPPTPRREGNALAAQLRAVPLLMDPSELESTFQAAVTRGPQRRRAFPWVFGTVAVLGSFVVLIVISHVRTTAQWTSPRVQAQVEPVPVEREVTRAPEVAVVEVVETEETPEVEAIEEIFESAGLEQLTRELRSRLEPGIRDMRGRPDDLEDAIFAELSRMNLGQVQVQATVLAWGGVQNDMPDAAEIHVWLMSRGNLEREMGAVGLVIGKYIQNYDLEVPKLRLTLEDEDEQIRRVDIDPEAAREFYRNRLDLIGFLTSL